MLIYVDDIIVTGSTTTAVRKTIDSLSSKFSIKDMGSLHYFLGVQVTPTVAGLFLDQHKYITNLLATVNMDGANPIATPLVPSASLSLNDGSTNCDATLYRKVVGSLQYLSLTRLDIAFTFNKLSQFMHKPTENHWTSVKRVLRYLKGTISHGLFLPRCSSLQLRAFSDTDWAGDPDDRSSTSAFVIYLGDYLVSWKSAKQRTAAKWSTEAGISSSIFCRL